MPKKFLHPDKKLAIKYVIAAFILFILDYLIPVFGFISVALLFLGIKPFIHEQNNHFRISYKSLKKMTAAYLIMKFAAFAPQIGHFTSHAFTVVQLIAMGVSAIYYIYMTHYFTEGVLLDAKVSKINYVKLGLNTPWILLGLFVMAHFICAVTFRQPIPSITVILSFLMCAYYGIKLYQASLVVYPSKKQKDL